MTKARNVADLGSNDVIETTATGVDVTGDLTATGNVGIGTSSPDEKLSVLGRVEVGASLGSGGDAIVLGQSPASLPSSNDKAYVSWGANATYGGANGDLVLVPRTSTTASLRILTGNGTPSERMRIAHNGDVSFYEDSGTTAKMIWDSSAESLGIGGTPAHKLDVTSDTTGLFRNRFKSTSGEQNQTDLLISNSNQDLYVGVSYVNGNNAFIDFRGADKFHIKDGGLNKVTIDSSGNVGIGTSNPSEKLEIVGTFAQQEGGVKNTVSSTSTGLEFTANAGSANVSRNFVFKSSTSGGGVTERMRIDSSGNVGIGTDSPARELTVKGGLLGFRNDTTGYASADGFDVGISGSNAYLAQRENASIIIETNGSERARIDASGSLLINTTSKVGLEKLRVQGGTSDAIRADVAGNSGSQFVSIRTSQGVDAWVLYAVSNGNHVGGLKNSTSGFYLVASSDRRLKENIEDVNHTVKIEDIKVRQFDWKSTGGSERYGFIAQELDEVFPEAVSKNPDDEDEMMGVDYARLVPLLVKEIQDLKKRIETLENK